MVDLRAWVGSDVSVRSAEHEERMVEPLGVLAMMQGEVVSLLTTGASSRK